MVFIDSPLRRQILIALMAAISMLVMLSLGFPLIPAAPYLKYEPSGAVILLCGLFLGKSAAVQCAFLKSVLYFLVHGGSPYGILSDLLATVVFAASASWGYERLCDARRIPLAGCCLIGTFAASAVMIPSNFIILPLQFGMSAESVLASMLYIIPYNLLKFICNSIFAVYLFPYILRAAQRLRLRK